MANGPKRHTITFRQFMDNPGQYTGKTKLYRLKTGKHVQEYEVTHVGWENGKRDVYLRTTANVTISNVAPSELLILQDLIKD